MPIAELIAYHVRIPLKKPIKHASHTRHETDNIIVRCVLDDGTEGFGEGVPREYVTGETIESAMELLKRSPIADQLEEYKNFPTAVKQIEKLSLAPIDGDQRGCQGNAARCALELALLDAFGKKFEMPLWSIPQIVTPKLYSPRQKVRYSGAITSTDGFKLRITCWKMRVFRFRQLKVKVGIPGQDDVKRLAIIRRITGKKMDLRVDANEAWSVKEAGDKIHELTPFNITSVEQPVPHEQAHELAEVRKRSKVPIMFDESLCSMFDAQQAVDKQMCDLFNLRLSKCGGFIPSLRLADFARKHDLGYQLGCQVGETCLLSAAGRHFACSVADIRYVEGSYDKHLVREALGTKDITFGWGGWAPVLTEPGLGVTVDPAALERVTIRKETLIG